MKKFLLLVSLLACLLISACTKDMDTDGGKQTQVKIKIDYLGDGGYYTDNIDGVPFGLTTGINGPFTIDPDGTYSIEYLPNSNWTTPAKITDWHPTSGITWIIHCYVSNNIAYIQTEPE